MKIPATMVAGVCLGFQKSVGPGNIAGDKGDSLGVFEGFFEPIFGAHEDEAAG